MRRVAQGWSLLRLVSLVVVLQQQLGFSRPLLATEDLRHQLQDVTSVVGLANEVRHSCFGACGSILQGGVRRDGDDRDHR